MKEKKMQRFLKTGLAVSWIAAWYSGFRIFKQKLTPEYHPLPGLIRKHVILALVWAVFLVFGGVMRLFRSGEEDPDQKLALFPTLFHCFISSAVIYTGIGLKKGKPTGVWVHVGLSLVSAGLFLIRGLKHLGNCLS